MNERTKLAPAGRSTALAKRQLPDIWDAALAGVIAETSRRVYKTSMVDFARFLLEAHDQPVPDEPKEIFVAALPLLESVTFHEVTDYREDLREKGYEPTTINAHLAALNNLFIRMMRMERIAKNPASAELVARMKTSSLSTTEGLSRSEAEEILRRCASDKTPAGRRDLAMLLMLIFNGLRRAELVSLDINGFRFIDEVPVYIVTGKGNKKRTMEFVPQVWDAVVAWVELVGDDAGPLFRGLGRPGKKGQKILKRRLTTNGVYHIIKQRADEAGIQKRISPHSLRHTYATLALLANVPIQEVQISMGHTSPDTTFRYFRALEQVGRSPTRAIKLSWEQDEAKEIP